VVRVALLAVVVGGTAAIGADAPKPTGFLENSTIDELSGLAVSHRDPTMLWGHNDSGDGPVLYRIGPDGEDLGSVVIPEAKAGDWEEMAAFDDARGPALLVGDIGDDFALRTFSTLYAIRDGGRGEGTRLLWKLPYRYADGPRDCEAFIVDSVRREIILITKRDRPPRLYRLPLPDRSGDDDHPAVAEFLGVLPDWPSATLKQRLRAPMASYFRYAPTAFAMSRDGLTGVLVTPHDGYLYRRAPQEPWFAALQRRPQVMPLPRFRQIEAAAISDDGRWLFVGSEGEPASFARVALPPAVP
jgi:hypothetical protein